MTIYNLLYIANLSTAAVFCVIWGGYLERGVAAGLFVYWLLVWWFVMNSPMVVGLNMIICMMFATTLLYLGEGLYIKLLVAIFTGIVLLSALAGLGVLSVERGQGAFANTYWNYRTWLLHLACFVLMGSCYARRMAH